MLYPADFFVEINNWGATQLPVRLNLAADRYKLCVKLITDMHGVSEACGMLFTVHVAATKSIFVNVAKCRQL